MLDNTDLAILGSSPGAGIAPGKKPQNRAIGRPALFAAQIGKMKVFIHGTLDIGIQATTGKQSEKAH